MKDLEIKVLQEITHPLYIERIENWKFQQLQQNSADPPTRMHSAYNLNGDYIGSIDVAEVLCDKYGIAPELATPGNSVCSIGFSAKHNKWYGWSHRAMCGFKIGDKLFEEDFGDDNTPFVQHGSKPIGDLTDARLAAQRFATSVASINGNAILLYTQYSPVAALILNQLDGQASAAQFAMLAEQYRDKARHGPQFKYLWNRRFLPWN